MKIDILQFQFEKFLHKYLFETDVEYKSWTWIGMSMCLFLCKNIRFIDSIKFAIKCIHNIPGYLLLLSTLGYNLKPLHNFKWIYLKAVQKHCILEFELYKGFNMLIVVLRDINYTLIQYIYSITKSLSNLSILR